MKSTSKAIALYPKAISHCRRRHPSAFARHIPCSLLAPLFRTKSPRSGLPCSTPPREIGNSKGDRACVATAQLDRSVGSSIGEGRARLGASGCTEGQRQRRQRQGQSLGFVVVQGFFICCLRTSRMCRCQLIWLNKLTAYTRLVDIWSSL